MTSNRMFPIVDKHFCYFVTFSAINWIRVFSYEQARSILIESLKFTQLEMDLAIHAYVIMPSHIHMIVSNKNYDNDQLKRALVSIRKFTGTRIIEFIKNGDTPFAKQLENHFMNDRKRMFWQEGWHAEAIHSFEFYKQKVDYIHDNPRRAGLVGLPENYPYSSAKTIMYGEPGLIELDYLV
ncbi:MAG: REP-associated tyrosine transposase [Anaerolineaceae bacterium]